MLTQRFLSKISIKIKFSYNLQNIKGIKINKHDKHIKFSTVEKTATSQFSDDPAPDPEAQSTDLQISSNIAVIYVVINANGARIIFNK